MFEIENILGGVLGGMIFALVHLAAQQLDKKSKAKRDKYKWQLQQERIKSRKTKESVVKPREK